ncbi:hypothetical protein V9T40_005579 [Parthenolecanium corni]|uniref:Protein Lines N-terminal domain-containing protein n=1 Tax=Parthenolecanium corni TaxID=536013 RepID=A0AAN9TUG6_9HEMI
MEHRLQKLAEMSGPWEDTPSASRVVEPELKVFQDHLLTNCLCKLPPTVSPDSLLRFSSVRGDTSVDQLLTQISCVELICAKSLKQSANPYRCRTLVDLRSDIVRRQSDIADFLISLADDDDQYVRYAAARTLTIYFIILRTRLNRSWMRKLVDWLTNRAPPHRMLFALDVLKRLVEWSDFEEHVLEDCFPEDEIPAPDCHMLSMHAERADSSDVKCVCVETLAPKWPRVVTQFATLIREQSDGYRTCTLTFLSLWEAIVSVKANLSIVDTKPFYGSLDASVSLLSSNVPPLVWKHVLSLFNEVLCYGSTLALQHDLAGEPCTLAHVIVRQVKDRRLLRIVPHISAGGGFGSTSNEGDKMLLKRMVLLVLKAVAVTIKEAKYDSSSDSSVGSEHEDEDRDMDMISRSIHDVLKKLDAFVKENEDFHPSTRLASWIVRLFVDQDDYLVESMVCCVDVARVLCYRNSSLLPELRKDLNPSETFLTFLNATSFNVDLMVDYLKSNETCFLLYILNFLKYLRDQWGEFIETCKYELPAVGKLFSDLRTRIEREVLINQITYNISPVISLLVACEQRICSPE